MNAVLTDARGCAVTGASAPALELYERAIASLWLQQGDTLALARAASAEAPAFVAARLLEAGILAASRDRRDYDAAGWVFAGVRNLSMNEREAAHCAALATLIDGDGAMACRIYDRILADEPRDVLALWVAQSMDYYLGNALALRERAGRVRSRWTPSLPGYHGVLAMHAFGLEESGDYAAAEEVALRALELEPRDVRAEHALLHVFEMQGRAFEGLRWMARRQQRGRPPVNHLYWHEALFHLQLDRPARALEVYDERMQADSLPDMIDAAALLWRLRLGGIEVGTRFRPLAARWAQHADDAYCAFNDLHAMMAFVGAARWDWAESLLATQARRAARSAAFGYDHMTRLVGLPASTALAAFGRGDYRRTDALLRALPPVAHRIGGSHAQRDVLNLTRAAAVACRPQAFQGEQNGLATTRRLAAA